MDGVIAAKEAAEKLSLKELKLLRTWLADRIASMERGMPIPGYTYPVSEKSKRMDDVFSKSKTISL